MEYKIAVRQITDENGRQQRFEYWLLIDHFTVGRFTLEDYGVSVRASPDSRTDLPRLTTSAVAIDELMTLLVEGQVGPSSLADVVQDWQTQQNRKIG